jgi:acetyl esterase
MPVVLDPDAAAVYKAFQEAGRPPYETVPHTTARELYLAGRAVSNPEPPELESAKPLSIAAPHGAIPARIYTPKTLRKTGGLAPCLVFYHGGGDLWCLAFVIPGRAQRANPESQESQVRCFASPRNDGH